MRAPRGNCGRSLTTSTLSLDKLLASSPVVPSDTALLNPHCPVLRPFVPIANLVILPAHGKSCTTR
jgi:hypothetical protein